MTKVLIVCTTSNGNTKRMAEAVAAGARSVAIKMFSGGNKLQATD